MICVTVGMSAAARGVNMGTTAASAEEDEADDDSAAVVADVPRVPKSGGTATEN